RDTQIFPLPVGCKNFVSVLLGGGIGITSKQEPQRWIGQRRDSDNSGGSFAAIPRLLTIVVSLKADCSADRPVVLLPPFAKLCGGTRKIGSKATRFDDLTLIPSGATSLDRDSEKPSTPNFAAAYAARPAGPTRPSMDDIWMMWPEARSRKCGSTALIIMIKPNRLVSICARNSASEVSSTGHTLP